MGHENLAPPGDGNIPIIAGIITPANRTSENSPLTLLTILFVRPVTLIMFSMFNMRNIISSRDIVSIEISELNDRTKNSLVDIFETTKIATDDNNIIIPTLAPFFTSITIEIIKIINTKIEIYKLITPNIININNITNRIDIQIILYFVHKNNFAFCT